MPSSSMNCTTSKAPVGSTSLRDPSRESMLIPRRTAPSMDGAEEALDRCISAATAGAEVGREDVGVLWSLPVAAASSPLPLRVAVPPAPLAPEFAFCACRSAHSSWRRRKCSRIRTKSACESTAWIGAPLALPKLSRLPGGRRSLALGSLSKSTPLSSTKLKRPPSCPTTVPGIQVLSPFGENWMRLVSWMVSFCRFFAFSFCASCSACGSTVTAVCTTWPTRVARFSASCCVSFCAIGPMPFFATPAWTASSMPGMPRGQSSRTAPTMSSFTMGQKSSNGISSDTAIMTVWTRIDGSTACSPAPSPDSVESAGAAERVFSDDTSSRTSSFLPSAAS
mmetsp:Transcript_31296/g.72382  ORF Transcript_31296/g.72382 Transcript_31296/m.72382 type:complete len:337 (-) Transcript_31296:1290-2300(-)